MRKKVAKEIETRTLSDMMIMRLCDNDGCTKYYFFVLCIFERGKEWIDVLWQHQQQHQLEQEAD